MYKLILFFAALAALLFFTLYTQYSGQLILILGADKVSMDIWFALVLLILANLLVIWCIRRLYAIKSLTSVLKRWQQSSRASKEKKIRQRAVMQVFAGNHVAAVDSLKKVAIDSVADQMLYISWLNQTHYREQLEQSLAELGQSKDVPSSWMIWFRAYLFNQQGKKDMALQILFDALEKGIYSAQMVRSVVEYADYAKHYHVLLSLEKSIRKVFKHSALEVLAQCYACQLDDLCAKDDHVGLVQKVNGLPRDISRLPQMLFYQLRVLSLTEQTSALKQSLLKSDLVADKRILPLVVDSSFLLDEKLEMIERALLMHPHHPDLLYVMSYLNAQRGHDQDAIKLIGQAIQSSLGVSIAGHQT